MNINHEYFMNLALKEAKKAFKKNEVPVGCIIVKNNKVISKGYNKKEKKKNSLYHAEIIAINNACKKLKTWRLDDCYIYVTLEPCPMCIGAILESRINTLIYAADNNKSNNNFNNINYNQNLNIIKNVLKKESEDLLKVFFKDLRLEKK